ncbi:MAG TPA: 1-acyl-sn-glycerol-3-phosphate acyltransferase, partial [Acidimicrobiales bacterium]|nr:1-acyl-sn-glycerol-3-phosphate acyltransferase [Acidimicrobiales bacterium]
MARAAAIVDVDRTLLTGRPGWLVRDALHRAGVAVPPGPLGPAMDAAATVSLSTQLSLLALQAGRGWPDATVREAATTAAEAALDAAPYLRPLLDDHRAAGAPVVLVSAAPPAIAEPLGELLGAEAVVGTTWAEGRGPLGPLEGPLVWARSKAAAGAAWLRSARMPGRRAHGYADNFFAGPLLSTLGHPVAVDPDTRLTLLARTRGWPIRHLDAPEGVVKVAGRELQEWFRPFTGLDPVLNARVEISGLEHVPARGGAILVFNHRSYFDAAVVGLVAARAGRAVRGLGKREVLDAPVVGPLARAIGTIRVDRGTGSDEPLDAASLAVRGGDVVMLAPEGTIPRGPAFF